MGLSIHYWGRLKSPDLIGALSEELEDIGKCLGWKITHLDEDFGSENSSQLVHSKKGAAITGHLPLKGVCFLPHERCETVDLFFDREGNLTSPITMAISGPVGEELPYLSVKTQFAGPDIHMALIKLLRYLKKKYFHVFEVIDEGSYWETEDEALLRKKMEFFAGKIESLTDILAESDLELDQASSPHKIADKIEQLLREKLKDL